MPKFADIFGPNMALAYRLDAISQGSKKSRFPGLNPLPLGLVMDAAHIEIIMHGAVWIIGAKIAIFLQWPKKGGFWQPPLIKCFIWNIIFLPQICKKVNLCLFL